MVILLSWWWLWLSATLTLLFVDAAVGTVVVGGVDAAFIAGLFGSWALRVRLMLWLGCGGVCIYRLLEVFSRFLFLLRASKYLFCSLVRPLMTR